MPRFSTASTGEKMKSLGIFLQCTPEGEGTSWSCQASAKITVINQKIPDESFTRSKFSIEKNCSEIALNLYRHAVISYKY